MTTIDINDVTRIVIRQCPVPPDLHEVRIERDIAMCAGERSVTQMFLSLQEMKQMLKTFDEYVAEKDVQ